MLKIQFRKNLQSAAGSKELDKRREMRNFAVGYRRRPIGLPLFRFALTLPKSVTDKHKINN